MKTWHRFKTSYFLYSFKRDPIAMSSFAVLMVLAMISILAPVIAPYNTYDTATFDIMDAETPPSWMEGGNEMFTLGTDIQGRDLLSTMIYGLRVSLLIGVGAVLFQAFVGIVVDHFFSRRPAGRGCAGHSPAGRLAAGCAQSEVV